MRRIALRGRDGKVRAYATVDDEDYAYLSAYRWALEETRGQRYAVRAVYLGANHRPRQARFKMHREIMGVTNPRIEVDHKNGRGLDNRRSNLRVVTHAQNLQNRQGPTRVSTSGVRGVSWDGARGKWQARAGLDGRTYHLGRFTHLADARAVVTRWRAEYMPYSKEGRT